MIGLQITVLLLVAVTGSAVALVRVPERQLIVMSLFGLTLAIMFAVFQAPDVALSQLAIGAVVLPLMALLGLVELRKRKK
ncbi:MAG TPA: hydrogenase subunit MbhD domain-containing protein [Pirellulales bacterium]